MNKFRLYLTLATLISAAFLGSTTVRAGRDTDSDTVGPTVLRTHLVSNVPGNAIVLDPNLVNPWGIAESPTSPFWVSNNNAGVATLYSVPGANNTAVSVNLLVVSIPSPVHPLGSDGTPTGAVFNVDLAGKGFEISDHTHTAPAVFLFATEDGTIVGWNPGVDPTGKFDGPGGVSTHGVIAVDNSANPTAADGAVYKGLAIATDGSGNTLLYATNFRAGTVEVYDTSFKPVTSSPDAFTDPHLKSGYAPFNIALIGDKLFVTYAVQDADRHDDVAGPAHGFVNMFDLDGTGRQRFAQHGHLNSPWGVAQAPASFGQFAGDILIGNFGDGRINAFDPGSGEFLGTVVNPKGQVILVDGLWSLRVGNGRAGGDSDKIYFTAGPNGEKDGLFGSLTPVAPGSPCEPFCF